MGLPYESVKQFLPYLVNDVNVNNVLQEALFEAENGGGLQMVTKLVARSSE